MALGHISLGAPRVVVSPVALSHSPSPSPSPEALSVALCPLPLAPSAWHQALPLALPLASSAPAHGAPGKGGDGASRRGGATRDTGGGDGEAASLLGPRRLQKLRWAVPAGVGRRRTGIGPGTWHQELPKVLPRPHTPCASASADPGPACASEQLDRPGAKQHIANHWPLIGATP
eukprot:gene4705-4888_t